jgi:nucleoid DNA-binding protein
MNTRNITHLADSLKKSILDHSGVRINIPICENILVDVLNDLAVFLDESGRVTLGDFGTFNLELREAKKVSGNLPQHKGREFTSPVRVDINFTPSSVLKDRVLQHLNKISRYDAKN